MSPVVPDGMRLPKALKPEWDECANDTFSVISQEKQRVESVSTG